MPRGFHELLDCWKFGFGSTRNLVIWERCLIFCFGVFGWRGMIDALRGGECILLDLNAMVLCTLLD
jgi:hypothetical protein